MTASRHRYQKEDSGNTACCHGCSPAGDSDAPLGGKREGQPQPRRRTRRLQRLRRRGGSSRFVQFSAVVTGVLSIIAVTCPGGAEAKVTSNGAMVWDGNGWIALVDDDKAPLPPPPKTDSWKRSDTTLFIGVSSFRDKRCPQTLVNYFTKAKYPQRVTIGVVQQNDHEDVDCVTEYCKLMGNHPEGPQCPYFNNIKTLRVEAKHAAGPCYGRHLQVLCS